MNIPQHKPNCSSNLSCLVYHGEGGCPGYKDCDCGFKGVKNPEKNECCQKCSINSGTRCRDSFCLGCHAYEPQRHTPKPEGVNDCSGCTDRHSEGTHQMHTKQHPCPKGGDPDCGYCFPPEVSPGKEKEECGCGRETILGGADVEVGGVCHRLGSPCYVVPLPPAKEEKVCSKDCECRGGYWKCHKEHGCDGTSDCKAFSAPTLTEQKGEWRELEKMAGLIHFIYQNEAKRQGDVRHADKYEDLPENIKEYDRVLAHWFLTELAQKEQSVKAEIEGMIVQSSMGFETVNGKRIWQLDLDYFLSLLSDKVNH